jgi:hypothetical protein
LFFEDLTAVVLESAVETSLVEDGTPGDSPELWRASDDAPELWTLQCNANHEMALAFTKSVNEM